MGITEEKYYRVRQRVKEVEAIPFLDVLKEELKKLRKNLKGKRVAIAVGSRKITGYREIVKECVEAIMERGGRVFIVPAMGSHAGGNAEEQREFLIKSGFTPEYLGCEIVSKDELIEVDGFLFDKFAYKCDYIFLVNRIKPHTAFSGSFGSGLMKLATIGLGKKEGAFRGHRVGLRNYIEKGFKCLLKEGKVLGGVGIVERYDGKIASIKFIPSYKIPETEISMMKMVKRIMLKLPFYPVDILVVRSIGKDISGTGIDTNVVGMERREGKRKKVKCVVALNISPESRGNGYGLGFADVITERIITNVDWKVTYTNALSTTCIEAIKIPFVLPADRDALIFAENFVNSPSPSVIIVENTSSLMVMLMNEEALKRSRGKVEVLERDISLKFDSFDNLDVPITI